MPHATIAGMTMSGKTFLAQTNARAFRAAGVGTLVLHKPGERWPEACANWQTDDPEKFLVKFWKAQRCACFMELSDAAVSKWDERFHACFTRGRHHGHRCFFVTQRAATVHPAIRENCESLYLFTCGAKGAAVWAEEFCDNVLLAAATLPQYNFMYKPTRYAPAKRMILE